MHISVWLYYFFFWSVWEYRNIEDRGLMGVLGNRKQGHSVSSRLREGSRFVHLKAFVYM